jgi:hypothetical protein
MTRVDVKSDSVLFLLFFFSDGNGKGRGERKKKDVKVGQATGVLVFQVYRMGVMCSCHGMSG